MAAEFTFLFGAFARFLTVADVLNEYLRQRELKVAPERIAYAVLAPADFFEENITRALTACATREEVRDRSCLHTPLPGERHRRHQKDVYRRVQARWDRGRIATR